jgi:hypothetical protein
MRATTPALWLAVLLLAGCASPGDAGEVADVAEVERTARPDDEFEDEVVIDQTLPLVETTRTFSGTILLRPLTGGGPTYVESGDPASFCFQLPANVKSIRGVFAFDPWQQAGLQFRSLQKPFTDAASWGGPVTDPVGYAVALFPASPITLEVPEASPGEWFTYGGPGIAGGAMQWTHDLTMVTYGPPTEDAVRAFEGTWDC